MNILTIRPYYLIIILLAFSCKSKSYINLGTDSINTAPDKSLILQGISIKQQHYVIKKSLYKNRERRKALKQICKLSDIGINQFRAGKLPESKYNQLQKEAKYVIQHAIYRMKIEDYSTNGDDPILEYLRTGINSLKLILSENGTI